MLKPEAQQIVQTQPELPEDLRTWLSERILVRLTFDALHAVQQETASRPADAPLPPGHLRVHQTLLTYAYGIALYRSDDIERQIFLDEQLRYLAANTCPSARDFRRFRRYNRIFLQRSLSQLLQLAFEAHQPGHSDHEGTAFAVVRAIRPAADCSVLFDCVAERRINEAVLADSMALDA